MAGEFWQILLVAILGSAATAAAVNAVTKRMELRAAAPRENAQTSATMLTAQGQENTRLNERNVALEARVEKLEQALEATNDRAEASEKRESLLMEAMHRWQVWAAQVTEIARTKEMVLPPPPTSPIANP